MRLECIRNHTYRDSNGYFYLVKADQNLILDILPTLQEKIYGPVNPIYSISETGNNLKIIFFSI
jgi:hypothetical protein